jgi:hypothetical protein
MPRARWLPKAQGRFITLDVHDVPFSTSDPLDGSDAMNPNPDYSVRYTRCRDSVNGRIH